MSNPPGGRVSPRSAVTRVMADGANERSTGPVLPGRPRHRDEWGIEFSRIVSFSDGVFAIAITLLVLQLDIPEHLPAGRTLFEEIGDQDGDLIAYAISFAVLGKLWLAHHRFFAAVERFDSVLMGLNLLYLAWIVLVPFTSEVLGDYGDDPDGVIIYAIVMCAVSLTFQVQIVYAYRKDLIRPPLQDMERHVAAPTNFLIAGVFALSIPVALLNPLVAVLMWPFIFLTGRRLADAVAALRS
jgi:TMEM175 potassium channel family protein